MKQLFTETQTRYYPNITDRSVDVEMYTIEAGYDPEMQVARLIVNGYSDARYHTTPVHASGQVSAVRQMLAAYDNELRQIGGYATYDAAEARLKEATAAKGTTGKLYEALEWLNEQAKGA